MGSWPAGWRILADRARPAWLKAATARFRCRPGRGHIVAAARLQLVQFTFSHATKADKQRKLKLETAHK